MPRSKSFQKESCRNAITAFAELLSIRLRALRERAGLTQHQVEQRTGVSEKVLSAYETGRITASAHVRDLVVLAGAYGVTVPQLVDVDFSAAAPPAPPTDDEKPLGEISPPTPRKSSVDHFECLPGSARMCDECREIWTAVEKAKGKIAC